MIRVVTIAGVREFDQATGYTVTVEPQRALGNLPGSVKIWRIDGFGQGKHQLLGMFAPGGWIGLEFGSEVEHITDFGFKGPNEQQAPAGSLPDSQPS
jgi:hypothetical protein